MKKIIYAILIFVSIQTYLHAQDYSLKDCLNYAVNKNSNLKIASLNYEISEKQINEQIGTGLPQIDFSSTLTDNLKVTTSLLPGELMGKPGIMVPVKMGTKYNFSAGLKLTQKIFDPSFWVGLEAAKLSRQYYSQNSEKTNETVFYDVSSAYYRALIAIKQLKNLENILKASEKTLAATELRYKNGMAKKTDVDKIKVSYNKTKSQVEQADLNFKQSLNVLKYKMGMPVEQEIILIDNLTESENTDKQIEELESNTESTITNRIDYRILQTQLALYETDKKNKMLSYLPTLSFTANYNYSAMRQEFDLLQSGKNWFNSSSIGLEFKLPIFSGLARYSRVQEAGLNVDIAKENLNLTSQAIKVDLSNAFIQYKSAIDNIKNEKENLDLAASVYKNTQTEYEQGASSSLDLIQAESALCDTQNLYYSKLLSLYIAELDFQKSKGSLINFLNNLK